MGIYRYGCFSTIDMNYMKKCLSIVNEIMIVNK